MATYSIEVPDRLLPGLRTVVARFNADNGSEDTVQDWLRRHIIDIAVQDELAAEQQRLVQQAQTDVTAALAAYRERLAADEPPAEEGGAA